MKQLVTAVAVALSLTGAPACGGEKEEDVLNDICNPLGSSDEWVRLLYFAGQIGVQQACQEYGCKDNWAEYLGKAYETGCAVKDITKNPVGSACKLVAIYDPNGRQVIQPICPTWGGTVNPNPVTPNPVTPPPPVTDADFDGVPDTQDACPAQSGPAQLNGCPPPSDSDGDGLLDGQDQCPTQPGPIQFNGCSCGNQPVFDSYGNLLGYRPVCY